MVYLASPYSHEYPSVMQRRFESVCKVAAALMAQGVIVFSPIAHTHPIAVQGSLPRGWEYWEKFDTDFIQASESMVVAMMPGWKESKGVQAEILIAERLGKPIVYMEVDA